MRMPLKLILWLFCVLFAFACGFTRQLLSTHWSAPIAWLYLFSMAGVNVRSLQFIIEYTGAIEILHKEREVMRLIKKFGRKQGLLIYVRMQKLRSPKDGLR